MNISKCFATVLTTLSLVGFYTISEACDAVFVQSKDNTIAGVTVGMTLDSVPPDSLGFSLAAGGSRIDTLSVGPGSPNPLTLSAQVSQGSLAAGCQASVINENNTTQCSGVIDPKYILSIDLATTQTCTSSVGGDGGDGGHNKGCVPGGKHDNGNHWGEYRHLGLPMPPPHSGKPGAVKKCGNGSDEGGSSGSGQVCTTSSKLTCNLVTVSSF